MAAREFVARAHRFGAAIAVGLGAIMLGVVGGLIVGLSPLLIGLLAGSVVVVASASLSWRDSRRRAGSRLGTSVILAHYGLAVIAVLGLIQVVPYGRDHKNPPVTGEPAWSSPRTRELMVSACYGCHSNEVDWPWYSNIAPISWAVTDHVDNGRDQINYSEFATHRGEAEETIEEILEGSMPPGYYTVFGLHPEADLSEAEIAELVAGLRATPGLAEEDEGREHDDDREEDEHDDDREEDDDDDDREEDDD